MRLAGLQVWTAQSKEPTEIVEELEFLVKLGNGKIYSIWNKSEVEGLDRYYLSEVERDNDAVTKLTAKVKELEDAIRDRLLRKATTIFIETEEHVAHFFAPLEQVLTK
jgi:hypothetical protein